MTHQFSIHYKGLSLVPLTEEYSECYRVLRNMPEVGKWFTYKGIIEPEQQSKWFFNYLMKPNDIMFAILDSEGNFIGGNSIYDIEGKGIAEYGRLIINPKYSGKGYGYKATYAAALIAKDQLKLKTLKLEVYENNLAAFRTYKKVGYMETGFTNDKNGAVMRTMELKLYHF